MIYLFIQTPFLTRKSLEVYYQCNTANLKSHKNTHSESIMFIYSTIVLFLKLWCVTEQAAVCMWQPVWPLLGFSNNGALAGSGWDYWCPSLQTPWGTSEVMMRAETNTHIQLCTQIHTETHTKATMQTCTVCCFPLCFFFLTLCGDWKYLVSGLLHLVVIWCHYILMDTAP